MTTETQPDREFDAYLAAGRFMIRRGVNSGNCVFYPRAIEPKTGDRWNGLRPPGTAPSVRLPSSTASRRLNPITWSWLISKKAPEFSTMDIAAIAARDALAEAGLRPADVDGLFFRDSTDTYGGLSFARYLGIHPTITDDNRVGDPLDMDAYMASRNVATPLKVLDCRLVTDGAAAIVLTRTEQARGLTAKPVAWMGDVSVTATKDSGAGAYAAARAVAKDIDLVEIYDAFTINTILFLEDLGFCPKGEGGRFVAGGRIAPGGGLPVNTNGGGLSCCHPGMFGLFTLVEAIRQPRGECGERQIKNRGLHFPMEMGAYCPARLP